MTRKSLLVASALVLSLLGCAKAPGILPASRPVAAAWDRMHAGVAEVDITPPPGLAMFGHGPEGRIATGYRLRLRCQAFVFASGNDVVALLPCDLAAPSHALQREVAARLLAKGYPIGGDRLFLMATHTHAGPAHYFESIKYSSSFSSYEPGHDKRVVAFLAERLTAVVAQAYDDLKPACVGWESSDVYGLTRNRSYAPFTANPSTSLPPDLVKALEEVTRRASPKPPPAPQPEKASTEPPSPPQPEKPAAGEDESEASVPATFSEAAVDPRLSVLRIDAPDLTKPPAESCVEPAAVRGAFVVFGMHPTATPNTNDLYHGDVFGFATRDVQTCLEAHGSGWTSGAECQRIPNGGARVVVGMAQGISGDVSPAYDYQGMREARRLGGLLAQRILEVHAKIREKRGLHHAGSVRRVYRELRFPGALFTPSWKGGLCWSPSIGTAAAGGAEAGPTRFRIVPETNEGRRLETPSGCHGHKLVLIPPNGHAPTDGSEFPAIGPIALVEIDDRFLATAPLELTTVAGRRIRDALEAAFGLKTVAVTGHTNSYLQYVATHAEYRYQHYEGASTLYGPHSAVFLLNQFRCLATYFKTGQDEGCRLKQEADINRLLQITVKPEPIVHRFDERDDADARELSTVAVHSAPEEGADACRISFDGPEPGVLAYPKRFEVQVFDNSGALVDDDNGTGMEVRYDYQTSRWSARWVPCLHPATPSAGDAQKIYDQGRASFDFCRGQNLTNGKLYQIYVRSRIPVRSNWFRLPDCHEEKR